MGIFNDPNDLSVILIVGMMLCLSRIGQSGAARLLWLLALTLMAYGMALTHSRGGFIAMAVAFMAYMTDRIGAWKAILIVTPLMLGLAFGLGRQMDMDFTDRDDTGQHRIRLWRDGLMQLQRAPVFGIGAGNFVEEAGLVAHNSFVQAYAELGFVGGTLFLAAFAGTMITFFQLRSRPRNNISAPTRRCLLACTVGMFVGMMSLSRNYTLPPYLVLGVASAYLRFAALESPQLVPRFTWAMCGRMLQWSLLFLCLMRIFVGVFAGTG
jgi:O-antigen ligase